MKSKKKNTPIPTPTPILPKKLPKALRGYNWLAVLQQWVANGDKIEAREWQISNLPNTSFITCTLSWRHPVKPYEDRKFLTETKNTIEEGVYTVMINFARGRKEMEEHKKLG